MNTTITFEQYVSKLITEENNTLDEKFVTDFMFSLESDEKLCVPIEKLVEWKVDTQKIHAKTRLNKMIKNGICQEGEDFSRTFEKSSGGRPSEKILLTIDCFKELCILACNQQGNKVRKYYLVLEKLFKRFSEEEFERQIEEKNKEIVELTETVLQEQKDGIKMKKSIQQSQAKFFHRWKFPVEGCVYILQNPDDKYNKYKIGLSTNINTRLTSDRTMIPSIKVRLLMYTEHYDMFERNIKIKYADKLELPSHEWVFEDLDRLIQSFKDIDKACGFNSRTETNIWRYNLEEPPTKNNIIEAVNIPSEYGKLSDKLVNILPTYLCRGEYLIRNENAPEGQRFCNGFCQAYRLSSQFMKRSRSFMTICQQCDSMVDAAHIKVLNGIMTYEEVRKNPSQILIGDNKKICRKCNKILDKTEFPLKRLQCKRCRNKTRSIFGEQFDEKLEEEINILESMLQDDREVKLNIYVKTEVHKIAQYLKLGRKYNDTKQIMINKILLHYKNKE